MNVRMNSPDGDAVALLIGAGGKHPFLSIGNDDSCYGTITHRGDLRRLAQGILTALGPPARKPSVRRRRKSR